MAFSDETIDLFEDVRTDTSPNAVRLGMEKHGAPASSVKPVVGSGLSNEGVIGTAKERNPANCFGLCVSGEFRCPPCQIFQKDTGAEPDGCKHIGGPCDVDSP